MVSPISASVRPQGGDAQENQSESKPVANGKNETSDICY